MPAFDAATYYKAGTEVTSGGGTYVADENVVGVAPPAAPWRMVAEETRASQLYDAGAGPIIRAPDGTKRRITVDNVGVLATVVVP